MDKGYKLVLLSDMIEELGEKETNSFLSEFSCPKNKDVETFLKKKAILFSKQGTAQTHLVFYVENNQKFFVGYFALAIKNFDIELTNKNLSSKLTKRLNRFVYYDKTNKVNRMSTILIGQLGKNYNNDNNNLITGDKLLRFACDKVKEVQKIAGGKFVYLECEDKSCLTEFYTRNGFLNFGIRKLDRDERDSLSGNYLMQMIKFLGN